MSKLNLKKQPVYRVFGDMGNGLPKLVLSDGSVTELILDSAFVVVDETRAKDSYDNFREDVVRYVEGDRDLQPDWKKNWAYGKHLIIGEGAKFFGLHRRVSQSDLYKAEMLLPFLAYAIATHAKEKCQTYKVILGASTPEMGFLPGEMARLTKGVHRMQVGANVLDLRVHLEAIVPEGSKVRVGDAVTRYLLLDLGDLTAILRLFLDGKAGKPVVQRFGVTTFLDLLGENIQHKFANGVDLAGLREVIRSWKMTTKERTVRLKGDELKTTKAFNEKEPDATKHLALTKKESYQEFPALMLNGVDITAEYKSTLEAWIDNIWTKVVEPMLRKIPVQVPIYGLGGGVQLPFSREMMEKRGVKVLDDPVLQNARSGFQAVVQSVNADKVEFPDWKKVEPVKAEESDASKSDVTEPTSAESEVTEAAIA
ncbi:hypothetical protein ACQ4M3_39495 [Leptolyngbya sp. AN03gr2]|uniref:hypothetical protein n=1 Tax=unclassified Leptolyngbya TaxID=2650499 RepID=UPI003D316EE5